MFFKIQSRLRTRKRNEQEKEMRMRRETLDMIQRTRLANSSSDSCFQIHRSQRRMKIRGRITRMRGDAERGKGEKQKEKEKIG